MPLLLRRIVRVYRQIDHSRRMTCFAIQPPFPDDSLRLGTRQASFEKSKNARLPTLTTCQRTATLAAELITTS